jgi:hypothetical protein
MARLSMLLEERAKINYYIEWLKIAKRVKILLNALTLMWPLEGAIENCQIIAYKNFTSTAIL